MTYTSLKTALLDYMTDTNSRETARALFTAYCIMEDIYVDTCECDNLVDELFNITPMGTDYDTFYNYMVELIV